VPMNTGAEAVDTALKIARKWGETVKGVPEGCGEIIACKGNFHGRTLGVISLSTEPQYRKNFGPFLPGMLTVPYDDVIALEAAITPNTVAFLVEPIQGEAGIRVPSEGYLRNVRALCDRHNVLLICDEVQTGFARTGKLFCFQHDEILPDLLTLGKALGGGVYPVSAVVGKAAVMRVLRPGDHGSTFGGNAIAAAVSLKAMELLSAPALTARVQRLGDMTMRYLRKHLKGNPLVVDIRGKGLFIGIEVVPSVGARVVVDLLKQAGVLSKDTHEVVVRLAPPLTVKRDELMLALERVVTVLQTLEAK
jgi:ornithine--oxo-acid transaminase